MVRSLINKKQQKMQKWAMYCFFENSNDTVDGLYIFLKSFLWMYFFMGNQKMVWKFWDYWGRGAKAQKTVKNSIFGRRMFCQVALVNI